MRDSNTLTDAEPQPDMVDRCMDAMGSMMGSTMGNSFTPRRAAGDLPGVAGRPRCDGALIFWGVRRFTKPDA